jgi:hypothetical protein
VEAVAFAVRSNETAREESEMRKPSHADLEMIVGHFLYHLSNEPDSRGVSPRMRFYGTLPTQAKLVFPSLDDATILRAVQMVMDANAEQSNLIDTDAGKWRSYS